MALFQESEPYKSTGMKEFFEIMLKDIYSDSEHYTRREYVVYGVVVPMLIMAAVIVAGIIENL